MTTSRVLVLGGAGAVGRLIAHRLRELGHDVTISGRTASALDEVAHRTSGISSVVADAHDHEALGRIGTVDAVVNTTGLVSLDIVQPWLDHGVPVVDVAASREEIRVLEQADASRATLLLSVGLVPGLSTLMGTHVAEADPHPSSINIGVLLGAGEDHGEASRRWTIDQLGHTIDGPTGTFRNFSAPVAVDFPGGFGTRRAYQFDFADHLVLSRQLDLPVTTLYCLDSRFGTSALALAARIPGAPRALLAADRFSKHTVRGSDWWAVTADTANSRLWAMGRGQSHSTAMVTAWATDRVLASERDTGVRHLNQVATFDEIRDALPDVGIAVASG